LRFERQPDDSVRATFPCDPQYQGYPDRLHGGIVATLLDAAMTHWLFARGLRGMTGRLNIRFRHPVRVANDAVVRAWLTRETPPVYTLSAEIDQDNRVCAVAEAKFMAEPVVHGPAT